MPVLVQPPTQIQPDTPVPQQWAFVNQNFQSIASALQTNGFKIVKTGTSSIPSESFNTGVNTYGVSPGVSTAIAHGLSVVPLVLAFALNTTGFYTLLPYTSWLAVSPGGLMQYTQSVQADATNIYCNSQMWGYSQYTTSPTVTIKYFILQETAT